MACHCTNQISLSKNLQKEWYTSNEIRDARNKDHQRFLTRNTMMSTFLTASDAYSDPGAPADKENPLYHVIEFSSLGVNNDDANITQSYARLFQHQETRDYVLAFRGSCGLSDAETDVEELLIGETDQYVSAIKLAKAVFQGVPENRTLTLTGHSLGGGKAAIAAIALHYDTTLPERRRTVEAVTFNSAAPNNTTITTGILVDGLFPDLEIVRKEAKSYITNLEMSGEIVAMVLCLTQILDVDALNTPILGQVIKLLGLPNPDQLRSVNTAFGEID